MNLNTPLAPPQPVEYGRYLIIINELGFIYSHFWDLARGIQKAGWNLFIASAAASAPERALRAGMNFCRIQPTFGIGNPVSEFRSFLELRDVIRSIRPDIVHTMSLKNVLMGGLLAKAEGVPTLLSSITGLGTLFTEDRTFYRLLRPLVLDGLRYVHHHKRSVMTFENQDDREYFIGKSVIPRERTFLIPGSGLAPDAIRPNTSNPTVPVILCVARMIRSKGISELVEAAKILRSQGFRFELQLVGDVDVRNPTSLNAMELEEIRTGGVVNWLGKRNDVPALLRVASIFCLPTYREGLPRSLVEASAAGLPIVATDVPGCREVVVDSVNGFLVPPRDGSALAHALGRLIQSRELREKMGRSSRDRFDNTFTTEHALRAFDRCYAALNVQLSLGVTK